MQYIRDLFASLYRKKDTFFKESSQYVSKCIIAVFLCPAPEVLDFAVLISRYEAFVKFLYSIMIY